MALPPDGAAAGGACVEMALDLDRGVDAELVVGVRGDPEPQRVAISGDHIDS